MRLALACLSLLALPATLLVVGEWNVASGDERFRVEAQEHLAQLDQARRMNPASVRRAPFAREILTLTGAGDGADVRDRVCGAETSSYDPLFPQLPERCGRVTFFRRVRRAAALALIAPVLAIVVLLGVKGEFRRPGGASVVALWTAVRGIHALLLAVALGAAGAATIPLESFGATRYLIAAAGVIALYLFSRREALAYLGPDPQRRFEPEPAPKLPRRRRR